MTPPSAPLGIIVLFASAAAGQTAAPQPAFEAASLKAVSSFPIDLRSHGMKGGPGSDDPGRIAYTQVTLMQLLEKAWNLQVGDAFRIVGPSWLRGGPVTVYNLTATIPPHTTNDRFHLMLQNLLIERFKIKLHRETRSFPGYELVVAPGGAKLHASAGPDAPDPPRGPTGAHDANGFLVLPPGHGSGVVMAGNALYAKFQNYTMAELVAGSYLISFISQATGEEQFHLVDKTGLSGKYDFTLKFDRRADSASVVFGPAVRATAPPEDASSADDPSGLPRLFKAVERQLGLRLVKVKAVPVDVVVIDAMERAPVED